MNTEYTFVNCPDYGEIEINPNLIGSQIGHYLHTYTKKPQDAADNLVISSIRDSAILLRMLTEKDRTVILEIIIADLKVNDVYQKAIQAENSYFEAFRIAFHESEFFKGLKSIDSISLSVMPLPDFSQIMAPLFPNAAISAAMKAFVSKPLIPDLSKMFQATNQLNTESNRLAKIFGTISFPNFTNAGELSKSLQFFAAQEQLFKQQVGVTVSAIASMNAVLAPDRKELKEVLSVISMQQRSMEQIFGQTTMMIASIQEQFSLSNKIDNSNVVQFAAVLESTI